MVAVAGCDLVGTGVSENTAVAVAGDDHIGRTRTRQDRDARDQIGIAIDVVVAIAQGDGVAAGVTVDIAVAIACANGIVAGLAQHQHVAVAQHDDVARAVG